MRPLVIHCSISLSLLMLLIARGGESVPPGEGPRSEGPAVPVALAWTPDGQLLVALRDRQAVAVVDLSKGRITSERALDVRPASMMTTESGLVLVGGINGEFAVLEKDLTVRHLRRLGRGPARVHALPEGKAAFASRWDRSVKILDLATGHVIAEQSVDLSPGALLVTPRGEILVADAFRGRLALIQPGHDQPPRHWSIDGVNLRGLALSADHKELLITQMARDGSSPVTRTNIDWGLVLSSKLAAVDLRPLRTPDPSPSTLQPRRLTLDGSGNGAADPSAIAVSHDGTKIYLALTGSHQVLLADRTLGPRSDNDLPPLGDSLRLRTCEVGRSPVAITLDPTGHWLITADSMSDTLTVVGAHDLTPVRAIRVGPEAPKRTIAQRGEARFLDGRASLDRWMSCASCHTDGHTNGLNFDTLGDGDYGNPKNTPTLFGLKSTAPYAWTGRFRTLEDQIEQSLRTSLHGPSPSPEQIDEIAAYLRSLEPPPAIRPADDPAAVRGARVFQQERCDRCHVPPTYASRPLRNPALADDSELFNPPSLRGVFYTSPYFHDGRAATLKDALDAHHPGRETPLDPADRDALEAFLESL